MTIQSFTKVISKLIQPTPVSDQTLARRAHPSWSRLKPIQFASNSAGGGGCGIYAADISGVKCVILYGDFGVLFWIYVWSGNKGAYFFYQKFSDLILCQVGVFCYITGGGWDENPPPPLDPPKKCQMLPCKISGKI